MLTDRSSPSDPSGSGTPPHKIQLYIDGVWCDGAAGETLAVINPATEAVVAHLCLATPADLERALAAAERGFYRWRALAAAQRADMLKAAGDLIRARADEMSRILTLEQGKTLAQARGELFATAAYFDDLADTAARLFGRIIPTAPDGAVRSVVYEPVGPVFGVAPWNLPAMMPGRKIANALAAGCSIILKPARETPQTAYRIAACCADAGIPAGVVNVVCGPSGPLSEQMIRSPVIRKISFTGSTEVGKELAQLAGAQMKKATMELGGHAPVIVCEDVDIARVVAQTIPARYGNAGQSCMAPTRFFVHESCYEAFAEAFAAAAHGLRVGNGLDDGVDMGPLASARRLGVMEELVADALGRGARLMAGGERLAGPGFFFAPTVLGEVPAEARIMSQEPFGPVTAIAPYRDLEDVIARANETPYGLAAYVFTRDLDRARYLAGALEAGLVGINAVAVAGPSTPFGGVKDSGLGREGAIEKLLETMVVKTITLGG